MNALDRRMLLAGTLATGLASRAFAQTPVPATRTGVAPGLPEPTETIDLWPKGAPGQPITPLIEIVQERSKDEQITDRAIWGISKPRMVVFRPAIPNGAAVLVTPGGGYKWVVIDKEGYEIGRWLAARGFTVFVLFYRLPGEGWKAGSDVSLSDAQRAVRLIRHRGRDYGILPERIVAMGFSAGGHVCADLTTRFALATYKPVDAADALSARPDISAPIYPVQSMSMPIAHAGSRELLLGKDPSPGLEAAHTPAANVTAQTPPCFIVHAEDDPTVPVENALQFREALKRHNVLVETHLFTNGGHGFGIRRAAGKPAEIWPQLFMSWAKSHGIG